MGSLAVFCVCWLAIIPSVEQSWGEHAATGSPRLVSRCVDCFSSVHYWSAVRTWAMASNVAMFGALSANSSLFPVIVVTIFTIVVPVSGVVSLPAVYEAIGA